MDAETGAHIVQPNKRLSQSRLEKLESIGFAWVAKNVRKPKPTVGGATTKPKKAPDDSKSASRNRLADIQWQEMYQRLTVYKEEQGVSEEHKRAYFFSIKGDSRFTCLRFFDDPFLTLSFSFDRYTRSGLPRSPKVRSRPQAWDLGRDPACALESRLSRRRYYGAP